MLNRMLNRMEEFRVQVTDFLSDRKNFWAIVIIVASAWILNLTGG